MMRRSKVDKGKRKTESEKSPQIRTEMYDRRDVQIEHTQKDGNREENGKEDVSMVGNR